MASPTRGEYITLVRGIDELMCASAAIDCFDWSGLFGAGPSRGANRAIPGQPGAVARQHVRGELFVDLSFRCLGSVNVDGLAQAASFRRPNVVRRIHEVRHFLTGASGQQLGLKLTTGDGTSTAPVTFKAFGSVEFPAPAIAEFSVLISVPSGLFPIPA